MDALILWVRRCLIEYFDEQNVTPEILRKAYDFRERVASGVAEITETFHVPIAVNVAELHSSYDYASDLLRKEPQLMQEIVTELILDVLKNRTNFEKLQTSQIVSPIVLSPTHSELYPEYPKSGLCSLRGVVLQRTIPTKFILTSKWKCQQSICRSLSPVICRKLPATPPLCYHCAGPLEEIPNARHHGTFTALKVPGSTQQLCQCRVEEDDRSCGVETQLGDEVVLVGVRRDEEFEVWGVQRPYRSLTCGGRIGQLRTRLRSSPWAFVRSLSEIIGGGLYPMHLFFHFRVGLLLSLASTSSSPPIPILAISRDTVPLRTLMTDALELAPRFVNPCLHGNLGGYILNGWRCAGSLLMASRGVCYMGDWHSYLGARGQAVRNAVESGKIVLENGDGESVPLKSAVWTYWDRPVSKKGLDQLDTLLKVFGLAWNVDLEPDLEQEFLEYTVGMKTVVRPDISREELRTYLETINGIRVQVSDEATKLLEQYFVCTRQVRGDTLPLRSLEILTSLTEAHARLNLRTVACPEDALAALELCERVLPPCDLYPRLPDGIWEFRDWLIANVVRRNI